MSKYVCKLIYVSTCNVEWEMSRSRYSKDFNAKVYHQCDIFDILKSGSPGDIVYDILMSNEAPEKIKYCNDNKIKFHIKLKKITGIVTHIIYSFTSYQDATAFKLVFG